MLSGVSAHRPRRAGRILKLAMVLIALLAVVVLVAAFRLRASVHRQVTHQSADRIITIAPGLGTTAIIKRLSDAGIVDSPRSLSVYLLMTGRSGSLKAGDYMFTSPISAVEAIEKIRRGEVYYERVTVPEGFNRFEIASTLAEKTGKASVDEFLRLMEDQSPLRRIAPEARNLEGYLFPDTYSYTTQTTARELVQTMVKRFDEVFSPEWATRASRERMTVHQVVTLASIIEEEARVPEDRPLISSVLMNRLNRGMLLAADPTFIYAAILADDYDGNPNQPRHRRRESRYNTYIYSGLPPGPITSPGRAALEAALFPAETDYLYFVVGRPDGKHKFSRTAAEHEMAVQQYYQLREAERRNKNQGGS